MAFAMTMKTTIAYSAILIIATVLGILFFDSTLSLSGDNGEFVVLGRSLASGQGLVYGNMPHPTAATKYPPGFPVLLGLVDLVLPDSILAMKALVLILFVVSCLLTYRVLSHEGDAATALVVTGLSLASCALLEFSHTVLSEVPYLAASLCALRAIQRCDRGVGALVGVVVFSALAYSMRSVGIVFIPTVSLVLLMRGRPREGLVAAAGILLLLLPWVLYTSQAGPGGYVKVLLSADPYGPNPEGATAMQLVGRFGANLWTYGFRFIPQVLLPGPFLFFKEAGEYHWWMWAAAVACGGAVSGYLLAWRRPTPVRVYLLVYLGVILLWPHVWSDRRFLIPVVPLLFNAAAVTVRDLAVRFLPKVYARRAVFALSVTAVVASNAVGCYHLYTQKGKIPLAWRRYFEAGDWIGKNSDSGAVVACRKPFLMHLASGRKTVSYPWASPMEVSAGLGASGAGLVVLDGLGFGSNLKYLAQAVLALDEQFPVLHRVNGSHTYVLGFEPKSVQVDSADVHRWWARTHRLEGDLAAAWASARRAIAAGGTRANLWDEYANIGTTYYMEGDKVSAKSIYEEVIKGAPDQAVALQNLAIIYHEAGRYDESAGLLEHLVALSPESWQVRATLGRVLLLAGRAEEGIGRLSAAVRMAPDRDDLWVALVEAHLAVRDSAAAMAVCVEGAERLPVSDRLRALSARLTLRKAGSR